MQTGRGGSRKRLGELLIDEGLITEDQLRVALEEQKNGNGLLGEILVDMGAVSERDIARAITSQNACPYISVLSHYITKEVLRLLPPAYLWKHQFLPLDRFGNILTIVSSSVLPDKLLREIEEISGCRVATYISSCSEIRSALAAHFPEEAKNALDNVFPDGQADSDNASSSKAVRVNPPAVENV